MIDAERRLSLNGDERMFEVSPKGSVGSASLTNLANRLLKQEE